MTHWQTPPWTRRSSPASDLAKVMSIITFLIGCVSTGDGGGGKCSLHWEGNPPAEFAQRVEATLSKPSLGCPHTPVWFIGGNSKLGATAITAIVRAPAGIPEAYLVAIGEGRESGDTVKLSGGFGADSRVSIRGVVPERGTKVLWVIGAVYADTPDADPLLTAYEPNSAVPWRGITGSDSANWKGALWNDRLFDPTARATAAGLLVTVCRRPPEGNREVDLIVTGAAGCEDYLLGDGGISRVGIPRVREFLRDSLTGHLRWRE